MRQGSQTEHLGDVVEVGSECDVQRALGPLVEVGSEYDVQRSIGPNEPGAAMAMRFAGGNRHKDCSPTVGTRLVRELVYANNRPLTYKTG